MTSNMAHPAVVHPASLRSPVQSRFPSDRRGAQRASSADRRKLRLNGPCPAFVQGVDANGQAFRNAAVLDNVSAGGLYMRMKSDMPVGEKIFVVFALSSQAADSTHGPKVAARGVIRRVDQHPDGAYGLAVMFLQHRFI
ncbi:MAG: hypothetical protein JWN98_696 [Abditibacteriota bacterium]|nr:hypothetical protein [Abditibacteriota bacterium]